MPTTTSYAEDLNELLQTISLLRKQINSSVSYKLCTVLESYELMFDRFCPFKEGDRIALAPGTKLCIDEQNGVVFEAGSSGTVVSRSYDSEANKFVFGIELDDDCWVDSYGVRHLLEPDRRFTYTALEDQIIKADQQEVSDQTGE